MPKIHGESTPPMLPAVLMIPKTVAENRPPKSVQVPQTVGWLQSLKNLTENNAQPAAAARLFGGPDGGADIVFDVPQYGVAPGQAAVFYDAEHDDEVIGGGWIVEGIR